MHVCAVLQPVPTVKVCVVSELPGLQRLMAAKQHDCCSVQQDDSQPQAAPQAGLPGLHSRAVELLLG